LLRDAQLHVTRIDAIKSKLWLNFDIKDALQPYYNMSPAILLKVLNSKCRERRRYVALPLDKPDRVRDVALLERLRAIVERTSCIA
jgi:hypothetical protein